MIVYLLIIGFLFLISILLTTFCQKKFLTTFLPLLISFLTLVIFCSLKSDHVGMDTSNYHSIFLNIKKNDFSYIFKSSIEPGFCFYTKIISLFTNSFTIYNFFVYILIWSSLAFFSYTHSDNPAMSLSVIATFSLQFALTAYRQMLAVSLVALGMSFYKIIKTPLLNTLSFFVFAVLGILFHVSTLVCLIIPLICVFAKKFNINIYLCIGVFVSFLVCSRPLYYLIADIVNTKYAPFENNIFPSTSIMSFAVFLYGYFFNYSKIFNQSSAAVNENNSSLSFKGKVIFYLRKSENEKDDVYFKTFTLLSLFAGITMSFALVSTVFTRIFVFFVPSLAIVIVDTVQNRKEKITRTTCFILIALLAMAYFAVTLIRSGFYHSFVPYETFF